VVTKGARFAVVTFAGLGRIGAAASLHAEVLSTGVIVVTCHSIAHADSVHAVVRHRAGVAVLAFAIHQRYMLATIFAITLILGALVPIIAQSDIVIANEGTFVDVAIAVVVDSITCLLDRLQGITGRQSIFRADPTPAAGTKFVGHVARGRERECHRLAGARANPRISHALQCAVPFDGDCRQT
jgi:hypothetical protein